MTSPRLRTVALRVLGVGLLALLGGEGLRAGEASAWFLPARADTTPGTAWAVSAVHVRGTVQGEHAHVVVEHTLVNQTPRTVELAAWLPLPGGGRLVDAIPTVDGSAVPARVLRGPSARDALLGALRARRDPGLLSLLGRDVVHIPEIVLAPQARRRLSLTYEQTLEPVRGTHDLGVPLWGLRGPAGQRPSLTVDLTLAPAPEPGVRDGRRRAGLRTTTVGPVYAIHHAVDVQRDEQGRARVFIDSELHPDEPDLRLFWSHTRDPVGMTMISTWPEGEELGAFLLVIEGGLPGPGVIEARPRRVVWVVDTSASMEGERLEGVRQACLDALVRLRPADRLQIVGAGPRPRLLHAGGPQPVTPALRATAERFLDDLRAEGMADLDAALRAALAPGAGVSGSDDPDTAPPLVLGVITDGRDASDADLGRGALERLDPERRVRVHGVGIGVDVDAPALRRLVAGRGGRCTWVPPRAWIPRHLGRAMATWFGTPLGALSLDLSRADPQDVHPAVLPDLPAATPLVVVGRYHTPGRPEVVLRDRGGPVERSFGRLLWLASPGNEDQGHAPLRTWHWRQQAHEIDALLQAPPARSRERLGPFLQAAIRHGLIGEYTWWVADEDADHNDRSRNARTLGRILTQYRQADPGALTFSLALNQARRRHAPLPPTRMQGAWMPAQGERDVVEVSYPGVRRWAGRSFYYRHRLGWVDAQVPDLSQVEAEVPRWSPSFFGLLETTTLAENQRLARRETLLLQVGDRVVRIVDAP